MYVQDVLRVIWIGYLKVHTVHMNIRSILSQKLNLPQKPRVVPLMFDPFENLFSSSSHATVEVVTRGCKERSQKI